MTVRSELRSKPGNVRQITALQCALSEIPEQCIVAQAGDSLNLVRNHLCYFVGALPDGKTAG